MSADQITQERIAELRERAATGGPDNAWRRSDYLAVLDALTASRADASRLQAERDAAIDQRNALQSAFSDERNEVDSIRTEVQRLTEEARRLREIEVSEDVYGMLTAHGSDGTMLVCGEFNSGREFREKYHVARRSDAGRVEVPEMPDSIVSVCLGELADLDNLNGCMEENLLRRGFEEGFKASRLSPSPQPATGAFGCCSRCGGVMELSAGWVPSYGNPDNSGGDPMAWPYCPKCDASPQPSADLASLIRLRYPRLLERGNPLYDATLAAAVEGQPSADVVVVPRGSGIGSVDMELLRIGHAWLNNRAGRELCSDRSCIRCRLADILFQVEREIDALRSSTNHDSKETP